jgi:hypothetical protein
MFSCITFGANDFLGIICGDTLPPSFTNLMSLIILGINSLHFVWVTFFVTLPYLSLACFNISYLLSKTQMTPQNEFMSLFLIDVQDLLDVCM